MCSAVGGMYWAFIVVGLLVIGAVGYFGFQVKSRLGTPQNPQPTSDYIIFSTGVELVWRRN